MQETRDSRPQLGLVENFTHMLGIDGDEAERMNRVLRFFFILHMDHGGGNLSTFSGKAVASGRASIYASISSAMSALSGPLHGRANQSCLEFVKRIGTSNEEEIETFVRDGLAIATRSAPIATATLHTASEVMFRPRISASRPFALRKR